MPKKIVIAGATGLIGKHLSMFLANSGYNVTALVRNAKKASTILNHKNISITDWDINHEPKLVSQFLEGAYCVINLAGAPVGAKRWNEKVKEELYNSRIQSTRQLVTALGLCNSKPEVYMTASGVGIYGFRGDEEITEESSKGNDFLAKLCIDWENEAHKADKFCRVVCMRTAVVLDKNEGALKELITPFKFFAGGWLGNGKQWFPWIHIKDVIEIYKLCIENEVSGAINASSPDVARNKEFSKVIGKAINRPCLFSVPGFALKIIVGEFAETLLNGQRIVPKRLKELGYKFHFSALNSALKDLLG